MKNFSFQNIFTLLILFCLGCSACQKTDDDQPTELIQLGGIYCLTGDQAGIDVPSSRGAQLAISQINENGGLLGRKVELLLKDGASDTAVVRQKTAEIFSEAPDVAAILGLSDTDLAIPAAREAAGHQRVFLTSGATSPLLPAQVPDYLYLACFGDNVQAAAAAEWAYQELNARTVTVLYDSVETYTILLQKYFVDRFESLGGQVLAVQGYNPGDISGVGQGLPTADLIFLSAEVAVEAQPIIQKLRNAGITAPIFGGDGYDSEDFWQGHPEITDVYYTTHGYLGADNPNALVQNFREAYHQAYGNLPDSFAALGYDAVNLLAEAIREAGSTDPELVRQALAQLEDVPGVTGTISFGNGSHIPRKSVAIMEVKAGGLVFRQELMPQVVPQP